ncbi:hypothetical protein RchiOBHm_Chr1g0367171 [Rosa chinensis]|uniref:Uncharacterized protein n=1 Tax=Rosa chinensis TaxID=74649 RepID=A0A2P6SKF8_ROSCH|nr:hypothetical protein RchiOBHm_Chr7g0195791 [Rosa chinensis]PRQ59165.1 hypothetical protein RchiOBHm_Chr1g0367171 [Rosa chinensis]
MGQPLICGDELQELNLWLGSIRAKERVDIPCEDMNHTCSKHA